MLTLHLIFSKIISFALLHHHQRRRRRQSYNYPAVLDGKAAMTE